MGAFFVLQQGERFTMCSRNELSQLLSVAPLLDVKVEGPIRGKDHFLTKVTFFFLKKDAPEEERERYQMVIRTRNADDVRVEGVFRAKAGVSVDLQVGSGELKLALSCKDTGRDCFILRVNMKGSNHVSYARLLNQEGQEVPPMKEKFKGPHHFTAPMIRKKHQQSKARSGIEKIPKRKSSKRDSHPN